MTALISVEDLTKQVSNNFQIFNLLLAQCNGGLAPEDIISCPSRDNDCFSCPDKGTCLFAVNGLGPSVCSDVLKDHEDQNIQTLCSGLSC